MPDPLALANCPVPLVIVNGAVVTVVLTPAISVGGPERPSPVTVAEKRTRSAEIKGQRAGERTVRVRRRHMHRKVVGELAASSRESSRPACWRPGFECRERR